MQFTFALPGDESPQLELQIPFWGRPRLHADGQEIEPLPERGRPFAIRLRDGTTCKLFVKGIGFDYLPKVIADGNEILLGRRLGWWEYGLGGLPILLVVAGGALGGLCGALAALVNFRILRLDQPLLVRAAAILSVTAVAILVYLILASLLLTLFPR